MSKDAETSAAFVCGHMLQAFADLQHWIDNGRKGNQDFFRRVVVRVSLDEALQIVNDMRITAEIFWSVEVTPENGSNSFSVPEMLVVTNYDQGMLTAIFTDTKSEADKAIGIANELLSNLLKG